MPSEPRGPWYSDKTISVLLYRINRRPPVDGPDLFSEQPPDILEHLEMVLGTSYSVESGRRFKREWRLGNLQFDHQARTMTGRIGFQRTDSATVAQYDEPSRSWRDSPQERDVSSVGPFAFDARSQYLAVAKHPDFKERTVASVFTQLLNEGERHRDWTSTDWAVEPLGDPASFTNWVQSVDVLQRVEVVFELPNPDAEPAFEQLFRRMNELHAGRMSEAVTARNREEGLDKQAVVGDEDLSQYRAAAEASYGYVKGDGQRNNRGTHFDQRQRVAREEIESGGPNAVSLTEQVLAALLRAVQRRRRGNR